MAETKKYDYTKINTLAVISLASSLTLFGAPAALITGYLSLAQLKQSNETGRWMAITGLVLGYVAIALSILFTVLGFVLRARHGVDFMGNNRFDDDQGGWNMNPMPGNN